MAASGLSMQHPDHLAQLTRFALALRECLRNFNDHTMGTQCVIKTNKKEKSSSKMVQPRE